MSDVKVTTVETKSGLLRNDNGKLSVKKTLGTVGVILFYVLCVLAVIREPSTETTLGVLERLGWFSSGLLGLRIASGAVSKIGQVQR